MPTVSRKSERLINLTIALLATKRYLTKSEIFRTVAGYDGEVDARDRMFERDKDDLRAIGIEIELGTFDPLFEDEAGYRIKSEKYKVQVDGLTPEDLILLNYAASSWRSASLSSESHSAIRKLKSLGIDTDMNALNATYIPKIYEPEQLADLIESITVRQKVSFEYRNISGIPELRNLAPYQLSYKNGFWYLIGLDLDKHELRTFRVDRCESNIRTISKTNSYEIDTELLHAVDSQSLEKVEIAVIALRKGRGLHFRQSVPAVEIDEEWEKIEVSYLDRDSLIEQVLWLGTDARILHPHDLIESIVESLQKAVSRNG